jgi:hypothetical protein
MSYMQGPHGQRRKLFTTTHRTTMRNLWRTERVEVLKDELLTVFVLSDGWRIYDDDWQDYQQLWDWLHNRLDLQGCPMLWRGERVLIDRKLIGVYPRQ